MIALLPLKLKDEDAERVRRNHQDALAELQKLRAIGMKVLGTFDLQDGVATPIPHGMARAVFAWCSPVRNAVSNGRLEEVRDGSYDRTKFIVLKATGFGATVSVDVAVL